MSFLVRVWVLCLIAVPAWAAHATLLLPTTELVVGQSVRFEVQVVDGKPLAVPTFDLPSALEIDYIGPSNMTIRTNGQLTRMVRFEYTLTALEAGEYSLGPAKVEIAAGADLQSNTVQVTVAAEAEKLDSVFAADIAFLPEEAWEGQVVLFRYRLRSRIRPSRTRWFPFEWEGLVAPRDGERPRREYAVEDDQGAIWVDDTLIPLIVTGTGDLTLDTAILQLHLPTDSDRNPLGLFGRTRTETVTVGPAPLKTRPLPDPPDDFSGLVGDFTLEGGFDKTTLAAGESATWTLRLLGNGALDGFALPKPDSDGVRFYDGSSTSSAHVRDGQYLSAARHTLSVVPTKAGKVKVPDLELVVFSPTKGDYVTLRAEGAVLQVAPGQGVASDVESFAPDEPAHTDVIVENPDIRGPKSIGLTRTVWLGPTLPFALGLAGLPGALALLLGGAELARARLEARRKPETAAVDPRARLRHLPEERQARLGELDAALREALALREGTAVSALDRTAAIEALPDALRDQVKGLTQALDRARFADGPADGLVDQVMVVVDALEAA